MPSVRIRYGALPRPGLCPEIANANGLVSGLGAVPNLMCSTYEKRRSANLDSKEPPSFAPYEYWEARVHHVPDYADCTARRARKAVRSNKKIAKLIEVLHKVCRFGSLRSGPINSDPVERRQSARFEWINGHPR